MAKPTIFLKKHDTRRTHRATVAQIYQRWDTLLAELNYVSDEEEAEELKQQIVAAPGLGRHGSL